MPIGHPMSMFDVAAVIVTFNRRALLERCLTAIRRQTAAPDHILIIDNGSSDGTVQWLEDWIPENLPSAKLVALGENLGGAGGFSTGAAAAYDLGAQWIWMMDDDACPHDDALEKLLAISPDPSSIYGSLAVSGADTAWPTVLAGETKAPVALANDIPEAAAVDALPFLGFMIHRSHVDRIGLPDAGFFIAADDIEYCLRAHRAGIQIIVAGLSRIEHPKASWRSVKAGSRSIVYLSLAPWKRYYDTRNRLLIAREYYGFRLFSQTIPGTLVRLLVTLKSEPNKLLQLRAFVAGTIDGLLGIKGRRHAKWGIPQ